MAFLFTIPFGIGKSATVDGPPTGLDPSLPVVILMHGLGDTSAAMRTPLSAYAAIAFDRSAGFSLYNDAGVHLTPPLTPVSGVFIDPVLPTVTSWNAALTAAGFATVTYDQSGPLIASDAAELGLLAAALASDSRLTGVSFAFVAHSRGGLVVRSFLAAAIRTPALAGFMARTTTLITLHSPNAGSGLGAAAATVNSLAASLQMAIATMGLPPFAPLATLRAAVGNPAQVELAPASATLAGIAAAEPVRGITYHTFGGTSTDWVRLWARVFTPESAIPIGAFLGVPLPLFHWSTSSVVVGSLLNYASFLPTEFLVGPTPGITETIAILAALAASTPELAPGIGDTLVTDASARLPFSATHTSNPLNHLEALYDPTLQRQVIAILSALRTPLPIARTLAVSVAPAPQLGALHAYTVTVTDAASGTAVSGASVTLHNYAVNGAAVAPLTGTTNGLGQCGLTVTLHSKTITAQVTSTYYDDFGKPHREREVVTRTLLPTLSVVATGFSSVSIALT